MKFRPILTAAAMTVAGIGGPAAFQTQAQAQARAVVLGDPLRSSRTSDNDLINLYDQMFLKLRINDKQQVSYNDAAAIAGSLPRPASLPLLREEAAAKTALDRSALPVLKLVQADPSLRSLETPGNAELVGAVFGKLKTYLSAHGTVMTAYATHLIQQGQPEAAVAIALRDDMANAGSLAALDLTGRTSETIRQAHAIIDHFTNEAAFAYLARNQIDLTLGNSNGLTVKFDKKRNIVRLPLTILDQRQRLGPAALAVRDIAARHAVDGEKAKYQTYDWPDGRHFNFPVTNNYDWNVNVASHIFLPDAIARLQALPQEMSKPALNVDDLPATGKQPKATHGRPAKPATLTPQQKPAQSPGQPINIDDLPTAGKQPTRHRQVQPQAQPAQSQRPKVRTTVTYIPLVRN